MPLKITLVSQWQRYLLSTKPTDRKDAEGNMIFEKVEEVISVATIQGRLGKNFPYYRY